MRRAILFTTEGTVRLVSDADFASLYVCTTIVPQPREGETLVDWLRGLVDVGMLPLDALAGCWAPAWAPAWGADGMVELLYYRPAGPGDEAPPPGQSARVLGDASGVGGARGHVHTPPAPVDASSGHVHVNHDRPAAGVNRDMSTSGQR